MSRSVSLGLLSFVRKRMVPVRNYDKHNDHENIDVPGFAYV